MLKFSKQWAVAGFKDIGLLRLKASGPPLNLPLAAPANARELLSIQLQEKWAVDINLTFSRHQKRKNWIPTYFQPYRSSNQNGVDQQQPVQSRQKFYAPLFALRRFAA